ncbi:hypothetical protein [Kitasatospora sp. NPDC059803]|uniref:hypothetical protein n=1 Tax=Kitasatospora sp. NPDC059803 TaxID=3346953 RepID=UPI0036624FF3
MVVILAAPAVVAYQSQCGGQSLRSELEAGDFPQKILHAQDSRGAEASAAPCPGGG